MSLLYASVQLQAAVSVRNQLVIMIILPSLIFVTWASASEVKENAAVSSSVLEAASVYAKDPGARRAMIKSLRVKKVKNDDILDMTDEQFDQEWREAL